MMTRQLLQGLGAASLVAALAVLSIPAQAAEVKYDVPFGFLVNGKALPAGNYQLSTNGSVVLVRGAREGAVVVTSAKQSREHDAKLVFHRYGAQYILREVHTGAGAGRMLPESGLERELLEQARSAAVSFERVTVPAL